MKYTVVHDFLDTLGATILPVNRAVGEDYPPEGVSVPDKWLAELVAHRTRNGKPILRAKQGKQKEATEASDAE